MIRPASLEASAKKVGLMVGSHEVRISWLDPKTDLVCFRRPTGQTCIARCEYGLECAFATRVCDHDLCRARPSAVHDGGCGHTPTPPPTHTHGHAVPRPNRFARDVEDGQILFSSIQPRTRAHVRLRTCATSHMRDFEHARLRARASQRTRDSAHTQLCARATSHMRVSVHMRPDLREFAFAGHGRYCNGSR